jgi:NADPH2:quinone reductase
MEANFQVPNQDGAGEIDEVGEGVDPARIGERVWVYNAAYQRPWGTAAELTVVPEAQAVRLPDHIPAMTAHRALFADGPIADQWVLIAGGAGGVGHHAIALAKRAGAGVISTVSSASKGRLAERARAHHVVNYREAGAADAIRRLAHDGVARIVEVAPISNSKLDEKVLAQDGTIAIYAAAAPEWAISPARLIYRNTKLRFILVYEMPAQAKAAAVRDITAALEAKELPSMDFIRFPLEEIAAAHDAVEAGAIGKVVLDVT